MGFEPNDHTLAFQMILCSLQIPVGARPFILAGGPSILTRVISSGLLSWLGYFSDLTSATTGQEFTRFIPTVCRKTPQY